MTSHPTTSTLAVDVVDGMERVSGAYPGYRRAHARGVCFDATFTPSGDAAGLTTAAHLQHERVPATVRFSNSNGSPHTLDGARAGRGMAVKFHLPDGTATDVVAVNLPVFLASTPENFLNLLGALEKDPVTGTTDPARVAAYIQRNPEAAAGFQAVATMPIPVSYGTARYWAIHAFEWTNAAGLRRFVRYRWEPGTGVHDLSEVDGTAQEPEYLTGELVRRLADGPVGFTLRVQLAEPGDPTDDATKEWPADREEIVAGHLEITAPVADQEHWAAEIFDPTRITDGIALSADPILAFRHDAYAVSYDRRSHNT
ncbi:catalase family peroxidase [Allokutzneria sp. A3M-2-11 16]|uniref:catalase family peroxidase n=1 Tax=Allokutzneria sp. A3M-2-11 16 TaxID=2962043 RepID=UPI0020B6E057|nr:catalase family peroxidase [Allokutzneria sp. A3M-2-11 16]MCP3798333.1 catalase family peroxidase [Allokutzneria sp. A3M-2-11 16]